MKKLFSAAAIMVAFSVTTPLNAQLLSIAPNGNETSKQIETVKDWSFYTDHENQILYIDFEKIDVNLSSVSVKDANNKPVFKDENLWQLPVNTIYEVDFSGKPKGQYTVELRTFTTTLKKVVTIK